MTPTKTSSTEHFAVPAQHDSLTVSSLKRLPADGFHPVLCCVEVREAGGVPQLLLWHQGAGPRRQRRSSIRLLPRGSSAQIPRPFLLQRFAKEGFFGRSGGKTGPWKVWGAAAGEDGRIGFWKERSVGPHKDGRVGVHRD